MITEKNEKAVLSSIIFMEDRFRKAPKEELPFILLNETQQLIPFRIASLFEYGKLKGISGVDRISENGEITDIFKNIVKHSPEKTALITSDSPEIGHYLLFVKEDDTNVIFSKDDPFQDHEVNLLVLMVQCYISARDVYHKKPFKLNKILTCIGLVLLIVSLLPVHSATYAKSEVDMENPFIIRSDVAGIIDHIFVQPNAIVHKGDNLVKLDEKQIMTNLAVAKKAEEIAQSEYEESAQGGMMGDTKARGQIQILQDKIEEEKEHVSYQEYLLSKSLIKSPVDGIAMFDDISSLVGKPVSIGESIMNISSETSHVLKMYVPVQEITTFQNDARVRFFDNLNPTSPHDGHVFYAGYTATNRPDGSAVYIYKANMDMQLRPGIQGTAEIIGPKRPLILWLLRKPIDYIRPWISF